MYLNYDPMQGNVTDHRAYQTRRPLPSLNQWVQSYWQLTVPNGRYHFHSVPDNCVDWIINLDCFEDNLLIPPFLSSTVFDIQGPACFFGIRFQILGHQGLISAPLGEWGQANNVQAKDLLAADIVDSVYQALVSTSCFETRCRELSTLLLASLTRCAVDPRLARYIHYCYNNGRSSLDLSDSRIAEFGVSARQLRRLSKQYFGLLPKDFGKVLKFQHALKAMTASQHNKRYLDLYYDQPHWVREFKRFSGVTPTQFQKMSVLYNQSCFD